MSDSEGSLATFLVTGANRGIGLEFCRQLQARQDHVIAVCRQASPELEAMGVEIESDIELSSEASIAALVQNLNGRPLDGVILNAGTLQSMGLENLDVEGIKRQFEVNALAPLLLAQALIGQMPRGAKLALITSRMGSIDDNTSGGSYGYRMSKVALNMAGRSLSIDLKPRGICGSHPPPRARQHTHDQLQSQRDQPRNSSTRAFGTN